MKKIVRIIGAALLSAAITVPFAGCDEGNAAPTSVPDSIQMQAAISQLEADAATVSSACKDYYAGVVSGVITSSDGKADGAAAPGASTSTRKTAASECTIGNALKYAGLDQYVPKLKNFSVSNDGSIFYVRSDQTSQKYKIDTEKTEKYQASLESFTLGELFNKN